MKFPMKVVCIDDEGCLARLFNGDTYIVKGEDYNTKGEKFYVLEKDSSMHDVRWFARRFKPLREVDAFYALDEMPIG